MDIDGYALVIGGGSGIGKACALQFAKEGVPGLMVADIDLQAAQAVAAGCQEVASAHGNTALRVEAAHVDVADEASVVRMTAHTLQVFPRIDYCVNNAGIGVEGLKETAEASATEFGRFQAVNVTGTFLVLCHVSAAMKRQPPRLVNRNLPERGSCRGAVVNMGSLASFVPQAGMLQYTASKHAVLGLTKNAALDNAAYGIRVNSVCPSWVDTPMVQRVVDEIPGFGEMIKRTVPFGRAACPEEVADAVMFLCSPRSSYMTGCSLVVDGGTSLRGILG